MFNLSQLRLMLAQQIANVVKQMASQANAVKAAAAPIGVANIKVLVRQEGDHIDIILRFIFQNEKLAKGMYEAIKKNL